MNDSENAHKFRFTRQYVLLIVGAYTGAFVIALCSRPFPGFFHPIVYLSLVFIAFLLLDLTYGIYCEVDKDKICRVDHFIIKKCIAIRDIRSLRLAPTWFVKDSGKTLIVESRDERRTDIIRMTDLAFSSEALQSIMVDLMNKNSQIRLIDQD
jgi:hypothetical protein